MQTARKMARERERSNIDKKNRPPNLSIQTGIAPKKVQKRVPSQNYSKPEFTEFPDKKLKDELMAQRWTDACSEIL